MGCHALLQRIFQTQGLNWHLLHWQTVSSTTWEAPSYPHTYAIHLVICNSHCLYLPNIPCIQPLLTVSTINTLVQATIFSQCLAYGRWSMNICTFPVRYSISLLLLLRLDLCYINLLILKEYITVLLLKKMEYIYSRGQIYPPE